MLEALVEDLAADKAGGASEEDFHCGVSDLCIWSTRVVDDMEGGEC